MNSSEEKIVNLSCPIIFFVDLSIGLNVKEIGLNLYITLKMLAFCGL